MAGLMVNVDHIATIREARGIDEPDPVIAAALAEFAGCDGIIVHLREDRRHIQDRDLELLRKTVKTKLNLEMASVPEMVRIAQKIKPDMATLVPEKRKELTTEGGLNVIANRRSMFIDPNPKQIEVSKEEIEADCIEIHTGAFSDAKSLRQEEVELQKIIDAVELASQLGLGINAGHGLDYHNIKKVVTIEEIEEFSIGHSIVARAVMVGMEKAVREMLTLIKG